MEVTEAPKYTAAWVASQCADKQWLDHHDCSLCGKMVGYIINNGEVWFRSSCGCSWSPPRPSNFADIADWLAMQKSDEVRDHIMAGLR